MTAGAGVEGMMRVLETERLVLRRLAETDAPFILGLLNEPSFLEFIGDRGVRTLEQAREYIVRGPIASYEQHGFGLYLILQKADLAPVGMCGLLKRPTLDDVDVGFALRPAFWGRGYAAEAAAAAMAYETQAHGLTRIVAIANPDNNASIGVLTRLGMAFEGLIRLSPEGAELRLFGRNAPTASGPEPQIERST